MTREEIREKIADLIYEAVFNSYHCEKIDEMADKILAIPELAIVDRSIKLPDEEWEEMDGKIMCRKPDGKMIHLFYRRASE